MAGDILCALADYYPWASPEVVAEMTPQLALFYWRAGIVGEEQRAEWMRARRQ